MIYNLKDCIMELSADPNDQKILQKLSEENPFLIEKEYMRAKVAYTVTCPACGKAQIGSGYLREYDFWRANHPYDIDHHCRFCGYIWNTDEYDPE